MKNPIAWMTFVLIAVIGLSSPSARRSVDQSGRNQTVAIDRKLQSLSENSAPSLGNIRLESPQEIRELLIRQQLSEQLNRNSAFSLQ